MPAVHESASGVFCVNTLTKASFSVTAESASESLEPSVPVRNTGSVQACLETIPWG